MDLGSTLSAGSTMHAGQYLESSDGHYKLVMQSDGNFVEYVGPRAVWASNTAGNSGAYLAAQTDGNVVIYTSGGAAVWATNTAGNSSDFLAIQPDANVVVYSSSNSPLWASGTQNPELGPGEELTSGQYILSTDRHFKLAMQSDGNLVEYVNNIPLWSSGTSGNSGAYAVVQSSDGNFVVYSSQGQPLWAANTGGNPGDDVALQTDANVVAYSSSGSPLWANGATDSELAPGEQLSDGQYLESPNRAYKFAMQGDGNLVLYNSSSPLWASNTAGNPGAFVGMQSTDGNLVVYSASTQPLWASNTGGNAGDSLHAQNDGNVVIYSSGGTALWATNTAGSGTGGGGTPNVSQGQAIVNAAQAMENAGYPYCFDGGSPTGPSVGKADPYPDPGYYTNCASIGKVGFDCTGLTLYAVNQGTGNAGLSHDSYQAKSAGGQVISSISSLLPGDVVYFDYNASNGLSYIDHAGIYVGQSNGQPMVLSAASEKWGIVTESINWYAAGGLHFVGAVRFWH